MTARVVCIIPAFNAAATLERVARGVRTALPEAVIVAVDDGSADDTRLVAGRWCHAVVRFDANRGKGVALRAGFRAALDAAADAVITIDADGQHDPTYAPRLVASLDAADIVLGTRARDTGSMPWRLRVTNRLAGAAIGSIIGHRILDAQCGYRAIRRVVLERVQANGDRYEYETDFLIRAALKGFRVASVPVPTLYGAPSHFRGVRDSARVVRAIWRHRAGAHH